MYRETNNIKRNRNQNRLFFKALLCFAGIIVLVFISLTYKNYRLKENKAPYVQIKEVLPVIEALIEVNAEDNMQISWDEVVELQKRFMVQQNEKERYMEFAELQIILQAFPIEAGDLVNGYKNDAWDVGLKDWNQIVERLVEIYGNGQIQLQDTLLLGMAEQITDEYRISITDNRIFTGEKLLNNCYWNIAEYMFSNVKAVCYKDSLLTVTGYTKDSGVLNNVFFSDVSDETVHLFYNGYHMMYPADLFDDISRDYDDEEMVQQVADIALDKGQMSVVAKKEEYVHGRLLQVGDTSIEIEGYGKYQTDEDMQIYKVFGELGSLNKNDLRIGYSFSDFVVEDGKIVACLVIKEEDMEYIRVLLKNSDMAGRYHEEVTGYCSQDCEWIEYEDGVEKSRKIIKKGETFHIGKEYIQRNGKRIKVLPCVLSAEITLESVKRSTGMPSYHGSLEITGDEEGLLIVNEVLLEDYLCKVVPSEMPSSYPKEALMAQAVCARTYAYDKMLNAGLPQLGAHVDDSAGFQVYNNIAEQVSTTEAVKATHNTIALYNEEPIGAYYYSTSCGMGSDTGIWHGSAVSPAYLQAKEIGSSGNVIDNGVSFSDVEFTPQALVEESVFEKWITGVKDSHYEAGEGWYRWFYEVGKMDVSHLEEVLEARFANNPNLILTKVDGRFESCKITGLGEITDMEIVKRLPGGIADELLITGSQATIKVISELNIRYVLADGITGVIRQTGDETAAMSTLPSAFIVLDTIEEKDRVVGYKITGGGFGHGVGMSQNGAKNMAKAGMNCEDILTFFYPGITLKTLHFGEES